MECSYDNPSIFLAQSPNEIQFTPKMSLETRRVQFWQPCWKFHPKSGIFRWLPKRYFIFFSAAYVICKKNCSFSTVYSGVKFIFFQWKTANSFYSKINDNSRVRTTAFSSKTFGVRVSVVPNIFYDLTLTFFDTGMSWITKRFIHELFRDCGTKNVRRNILIPPPLIKTFSVPEINATVKDSLRRFLAQ